MRGSPHPRPKRKCAKRARARRECAKRARARRECAKRSKPAETDAPDPRAPRTTWVHWMLYDLPADVRELAENVAELPRGTREGLNGWKRTGWAGPCPLIGRHRYFFELCALRRTLGELDHPRRGELIAAMDGLVLAKTVLMGTYEREKRR